MFERLLKGCRMKRNRRSIFLSIILLFAMLLTSCGGGGLDDPSVMTAVAMTVAAHDTQLAEAASTPTLTEVPQTPTPGGNMTPTRQSPATFSPPTAPPPVGSTDPCLSATWIADVTVPDGQIMTPGQYFWKTWRLKNSGTCTWDSTYKIVYWSGELMGGYIEYPFPEVTPPGDEAEVSIYLQAPSSNGNYKGEWKIQSPWGGAFGVGEYDVPFSVQVNVTDSSKPGYGVTAVTYNIIRKPEAGCATNVWYTVYATITTNGPVEVYYRWLQSDHNDSNDKRLLFKEAGSQTLTREWSFHLGANAGSKWMQVLITSQDMQDFGKEYFDYLCY
jgi:hypothetical protein